MKDYIEDRMIVNIWFRRSCLLFTKKTEIKYSGVDIDSGAVVSTIYLIKVIY